MSQRGSLHRAAWHTLQTLLVVALAMLLFLPHCAVADLADMAEDQAQLLALETALNASCPALPTSTLDAVVKLIKQGMLYDASSPIKFLLPILPLTPVLRRLSEEYVEMYQVPIAPVTPLALPSNRTAAFDYYFGVKGIGQEYDARVWSSIDDPLVSYQAMSYTNPPVAAYATGDLEVAASLENVSEIPAQFSPKGFWPLWMLMIYNSYMMERNNLTVPTTWHELLDLAARVNGTDLNGDGEADAALCLDLAPGCKAGYVLSTIYASMAQTTGSTQGIWFDRVTFQPLFPNPAMAEALRLMGELSQYGSGSTCDVMNARFVNGSCLMTLDWGSSFLYTQQNEYSNGVLGNIGFARPPGSEVVWAGQDASASFVPGVHGSGLTSCQTQPSACPLGRHPINRTDRPLINFATLRSLIPVSYSGNTESDASRQAITTVFLSWMHHEYEELYNAMSAKSALNLSADTNITDEIRQQTAFAMQDAYRGAIVLLGDLAPYNATDAIDLALPFNQLYRLAVDNMALQAVQGDADVVQIMDHGLQDFAFVQSVFPYNHTILLWYNATLGIQASQNQNQAEGPGPQRGTQHYLDTVLPAVLVPAFAILLVAIVFFWNSWMKQRYRTLLGKMMPPGVGESTTLVVTDIQSSTALWESLAPEVMDMAMRLHHRCIRDLLRTHSGYESMTEGDMFACAFYTTANALAFCMEAQVALCHMDWPAELLQHPEAREVFVQTSSADSAVHERSPRGGSRSIAPEHLHLTDSVWPAPRTHSSLEGDTGNIVSLASRASSAVVTSTAPGSRMLLKSASNSLKPAGSLKTCEGPWSGLNVQFSLSTNINVPSSAFPHKALITGTPGSPSAFSRWAANGGLASKSTVENQPPVSGGYSSENHGSGASLADDDAPRHVPPCPASDSQARAQDGRSLQALLELPLFRGALAAATQRMLRTRSSLRGRASGKALSTGNVAGDMTTINDDDQASNDDSGSSVVLGLGWTWVDLLKAKHPEVTVPHQAAHHVSTDTNPRTPSRLHLSKLAADAPAHTVVLRGLRVRMGIHSGVSADESFLDHGTQRQMYIGASMALAKAVADAAQGGMVLMSASAFAQHNQRVAGRSATASIILIHAGLHDLGVAPGACAASNMRTGRGLSASGAKEDLSTLSWNQRLLLRLKALWCCSLLGVGGSRRSTPAPSSDGVILASAERGPAPPHGSKDSPPMPLGLTPPGTPRALTQQESSRTLQRQPSGNNNNNNNNNSPAYQPTGSAGAMQRQSSLNASVQRQGSASVLHRQASCRRAHLSVGSNAQGLQPPPTAAQAAVVAVARHGIQGRSAASRAGSIRVELASSSALGMELYMATPVALQPRLAHLGPVRSRRMMLPGTLSAPMPAAAIAFMHAYGASILLADMPVPARAAMSTFCTCVLEQLAQARGYLVLNADTFILAAFTEPASAIAWALTCNHELSQQEWPEEILENDLGREVLQVAPRMEPTIERRLAASGHLSGLVPCLLRSGDALAAPSAHLVQVGDPLELQPVETGHTVALLPAPRSTERPHATVVTEGASTLLEAARGSTEHAGNNSAGSVRTFHSHSTNVVAARGIRARCGIDVGTIRPELHPTTGRMEYRGRVMNRAARIAAKAAPGQVLASAMAWSISEEEFEMVNAAITAHHLGAFELKGVQEPMELVSCSRAAARQ